MKSCRIVLVLSLVCLAAADPAISNSLGTGKEASKRSALWNLFGWGSPSVPPPTSPPQLNYYAGGPCYQPTTTTTPNPFQQLPLCPLQQFPNQFGPGPVYPGQQGQIPGPYPPVYPGQPGPIVPPQGNPDQPEQVVPPQPSQIAPGQSPDIAPGQNVPVQPPQGIPDQLPQPGPFPPGPPFNPGQPPFNPGQPPFNPGQPPFNPGQPPFNPGQPPFNPGQPPLNPGQPPFNPGQPPFNPGQPPFNPGQPPLNPGQPPFNPGQPPFNPGQQPFNPQPGPFSPEPQPGQVNPRPFNPEPFQPYVPADPQPPPPSGLFPGFPPGLPQPPQGIVPTPPAGIPTPPAGIPPPPQGIPPAPPGFPQFPPPPTGQLVPVQPGKFTPDQSQCFPAPEPCLPVPTGQFNPGDQGPLPGPLRPFPVGPQPEPSEPVPSFGSYCAGVPVGPVIPPGFFLADTFLQQQRFRDQSRPVPVDAPTCSIIEVIQQLRLRTVYTLIQQAGLEQLFLQTSKYTFFAPVDAAFEKLPAWFLESLKNDIKLLRAFLLNHFVKDTVSLSSLGNEYRVMNARAGGHRLRINVYHQDTDYRVYTVDGAKVIVGEIQAAEGLLHVLDKVLVPNPPRLHSEYLAELPDFKQFMGAVLESGLLPVLEDKDSPVTLFIPYNHAFQSFDYGSISGNQAAVQNFVSYHIVNGTYFSAGLLHGQYLTTNYYKEIKMGVATDGFTQYADTINGRVKILKADIPVLNGVAHVIDSCLSYNREFLFDAEISEFSMDFGTFKRSMTLNKKELEREFLESHH